MDRDTMALYIIAAIAFVFALLNAIIYILKRNKTKQTIGTVLSITMPNPKAAKANSKWAKVTYQINGKSYTSQNRIQVPMSAIIGSAVNVRYDIMHPEKLYSYSLLRFIIALSITAFCLAIATISLS